MAELRDYQQTLLEQAVAGLIPSKARGMLQLPTPAAARPTSPGRC